MCASVVIMRPCCHRRRPAFASSATSPSAMPTPATPTPAMMASSASCSSHALFSAVDCEHVGDTASAASAHRRASSRLPARKCATASKYSGSRCGLASAPSLSSPDEHRPREGCQLVASEATQARRARTRGQHLAGAVHVAVRFAVRERPREAQLRRRDRVVFAPPRGGLAPACMHAAPQQRRAHSARTARGAPEADAAAAAADSSAAQVSTSARSTIGRFTNGMLHARRKGTQRRRGDAVRGGECAWRRRRGAPAQSRGLLPRVDAGAA